ncbi:TetR/AcrR family transcriptional regulator [Actinomadura sp. NEAU-AAG7]|uniref:TetR/AcrR family transcriptional regulator n=1 Tax=Actinomadura sp. NEAU-AAG7 TaxID=2839640 RepID=UPI001BE46C45|nr:TetR/AcrR family transcriptional regulator [Actinomadura sp. NEAU-AAG7]MBT2209571.1 TetR family transcriptional regulator [Actinomadura sp. NEAU-AAG7]
MRADARRNRELIVEAALDRFAGSGPAASMEEIARAAGLGVGTLYRHFPDRRALVEEIAGRSLRCLRTGLRSLAEQDLSRRDVIARYVGYCAGQPLALIKALAEENEAPEERLELQDELNGLLEALARQAQEEGTVRGDISPREVVELLSVVVCRPGARADDALTRVALDGLRA